VRRIARVALIQTIQFGGYLLIAADHVLQQVTLVSVVSPLLTFELECTHGDVDVQGSSLFRDVRPRMFPMKFAITVGAGLLDQSGALTAALPNMPRSGRTAHSQASRHTGPCS
jgi:hypothetical protein